MPWSSIASATTQTCIAAGLEARLSPGWLRPDRKSLSLWNVISAHLFAKRGEGADTVSEDRLDAPRHGDLHLARVVDGPHADFLAGFPALLQELLPLGAHEQREVDGEAVAGVPEVGADNVGREADIVAAKKGEVVVSRPQEERVPDAENESGCEKGLPRRMFSASENGQRMMTASSRYDASHLGLHVSASFASAHQFCSQRGALGHSAFCSRSVHQRRQP